MPNRIRAVYWDSCVFIDWMKADKPERLPFIQQVVEAAESDKVLIVTSTWTLVEVVRTHGGQIADEDDETKIKQFMRNPFIELRSVDREVAEKSRELQRGAARNDMKMPKADSVHLATALLCRIAEFHTFDDKDLKPHSGKWGDPPLTICWPRYADPSIPF